HRLVQGKLAYLAPEFVAGKLDARADLWSLGVVMHELLTSRQLFDVPNDPEALARKHKLPIPRPSLANPRVPPAVEPIVLTALARDPSKRWQTAAELRTALRAEIARPGQFVDHRHVAEWVRWVLAQKPGTEASGVSQLASLMPATPAPAAPARAPE